ncbi:MAG: response regulator [Acidobacteria bacterium]|nr:response regulator [Acidobacteriota bacterium]
MQQIKILYAEDYDLVLFTVKQLLELEGWSVEICRDGAACLKKLESREHFDVIVLDTELPEVCGLELLRRSRTLDHRTSTPVIIFSSGERESESRSAGADAYLNKPAGIRDLVQTIENLLYKHGEQLNASHAPASRKYL